MTSDIQWFPGHMAKTGRELSESLKLADLVIEVLDARIPKSSGNPDFDDLFRGRRRIFVLNKADLADPARSRKWKEYLRAGYGETVFTNALKGEGVAFVRSALRAAAGQKTARQADRGVKMRPLRAIVAGIPNSGKSSLINILSGRAAAITGDKPGVTKRRQWVSIENGIELLDTPGVLWPKFSDPEVALHLAFTGAIKDDVYDITDAAERLLTELRRDYSALVSKRYGDAAPAPEAADADGSGYPQLKAADFTGSGYQQLKAADVTGSEYPLLEMAGRRRGFLMKGGLIDLERTAATVLDEFRSARIGRVTLELP